MMTVAPLLSAQSQETRGQADIALQGYYLGGSQSLSTTSGVSMRFSDFLPGLGLLSGNLESYGSDRMRRWILAGFLLGLAGLMRWQLLGFAVLLAGEALFAFGRRSLGGQMRANRAC